MSLNKGEPMLNKIKTAEFNKTVNVIKCVYLCIFTVYLIVREVLALNYFIDNILVSGFFFGTAIIFIGFDILNKKYCFNTRYILFAVIFLVITGISCIVNYKYGLFSNIKAMAGFVIYLFLVYPESLKDAKKTTLKACMKTAYCTISAISVLSIPMYFFDVSYLIVNRDSGFSTRYGRLWGLFQEANIGAFYALVAIFISVLLFKESKSLFKKIILVVLGLFNFSYISLSNSRMTNVCIIAALIWISLVVIFTKIKTKTVYRVLLVAAALTVSVLLPMSAITVTNSTLPLVKKGIWSATSLDSYIYIHQVYDNLYEAGKIEVTNGLLSQVDIEEIKTQTTFDPVIRTDKKDDYSNGRFERWEGGLSVFLKSPIIGTSPRGIIEFAKVNAPETMIAKNHAVHNTYLELLAGTGVLGSIFIFAFLLFAAYHIIKKTLFNNPSLETVIISTMVLIIIVTGVFLADLFCFQTTFSGFAFWLFMGYCLNESVEDCKNSAVYRFLKRKFKRNQAL